MIEKCTMFIIKKEGKFKKKKTEGIELPDQESIRTLKEKESNKYQGILEEITIKQSEKKVRKKYLRLTEKNV